MIRRAAGRTATTVLVVAALGLALWFIYAAVAGATLITFRTGSMSPTIPQGALAISLPTTADQLQIGDVVTVQRANEALPVTHRVIEISAVQPPEPNSADMRAAAPGGGPPDLSDPRARQIVMQGDDNDTPDHLPYLVTDVRKVVFSVPQVGNVLMLLQSPIGTGTLLVLVAALTTWAFWPPRPTDGDTSPVENTSSVATEPQPGESTPSLPAQASLAPGSSNSPVRPEPRHAMEASR